MGWVECVFGFLTVFGCGLGLYIFGIWAGKQEKPMGFWANGKPFNPKAVTDIPEYVRAYGKLFRRFAVPCLISGILLPFDAFVSIVILVLWGTFGIWWLICSYKRIEKQYILQ